MSGINFDATQVAPNAGFAPVEKGKYPVAITQSEFKPTSNGAGKLLEFHCRINGGVNHGRDIMFNLNWENPSAKAVEIGRGQLSAICHATNVMHLQDTQQLHNIPFMLEVDVTPDGKYNEVKGIYPIGPVNTMTQAQPVQQVMQQPMAQPQYVQQQPQFVPQQQPVQPVYPQQQPQQQFAPQGQANPMAQYEAMAQPVQQVMQPVQQVQQSNDVPDWIKNQQLAAQGQQPMGNA